MKIKNILIISVIMLLACGCASSGYNRSYMLTDSDFSTNTQKKTESNIKSIKELK